MRDNLTIRSEIFNTLVADFDNILELTLKNMIDKQEDSGEISVKINIELLKGYIPVLDVEDETETRDVVIPKFSHKISSTMKIEEKASGKAKNGYELFFNDYTGEYEIRKLDDGQVSLNL